MTLVKVLLHISSEEQRERLLERLTDARKHWKYNPADVDARRRWSDYQAAYAEALARRGTPQASWFVVPADRTWYRDRRSRTCCARRSSTCTLSYPPADFDVERQRLVGEKSRVRRS